MQEEKLAKGRCRIAKKKLSAIFQKFRKGRWWGGHCAHLSQIACQICTTLPVFRFVHQNKRTQNCRKFGAILCKDPLSNAPLSGAKKKAREEIQHKNFGGPKAPPPSKFFMQAFLLHFEGKRGPKHKEFAGSGVPWGRAGRGGGGFCPNSLCLCPFWFLIVQLSDFSLPDSEAHLKQRFTEVYLNARKQGDIIKVKKKKQLFLFM